MTLSEITQLRAIDIAERSFSKCQKVIFADLPLVEECSFSNRVFSKTEEIHVDSSGVGESILDISSEVEMALQMVR